MTNALKYFVGKFCTIFTKSVQKQVSKEEEILYFSGFVEEVNSSYVLISNVNNNSKSIFNWSNIVGICEEEILNPEKEEDAEIINKIKENNSQNIDISHLTDLMKTAKNS